MVKQDLKTTIATLPRERLSDFDVPHEIREGLLDEIFGAFNAPSASKHGATVMTHEASLAADRERRTGKGNPNAAKPRVL